MTVVTSTNGTKEQGTKTEDGGREGEEKDKTYRVDFIKCPATYQAGTSVPLEHGRSSFHIDPCPMLNVDIVYGLDHKCSSTLWAVVRRPAGMDQATGRDSKRAGLP